MNFLFVISILALLSVQTPCCYGFRHYPGQHLNMVAIDAIQDELRRIANCSAKPPCRIINKNDGKEPSKNVSFIVCHGTTGTIDTLEGIKAFPVWELRKAKDRFFDNEPAADLIHCQGRDTIDNKGNSQVPTWQVFEQLARWISETRQPFYHGPGNSHRHLIISFYRTQFENGVLSDPVLCKFLFLLKRINLKIWFRSTNLNRIGRHSFDRAECSYRLKFEPSKLAPLHISEFEVSGSRELRVDDHAFYGLHVASLKLWFNTAISLHRSAFEGSVVEKLYLSHNSIKRIDSRTLSVLLPQLQSLRLDHNSISSLEPDASLADRKSVQLEWIAIFKHFARLFPKSYWDRIRISPNEWNCTSSSVLLRWIGCAFDDFGFLFIRCSQPAEWRGRSLGEIPFIRDKTYCQDPKKLAKKLDQKKKQLKLQLIKMSLSKLNQYNGYGKELQKQGKTVFGYDQFKPKV